MTHTREGMELHFGASAPIGDSARTTACTRTAAATAASPGVAVRPVTRSSLLTMVQSVELLLDESLDAAVRDEWTRMLDGGIDSQGRIRSPTNRPHVTLFVSAQIPPEVEEAARRAISDTPLSVRLGGVVVFGDRHATLARLVVPSSALLDLHARLFGLLAACPGVPAHIRPGEWTPHVTLARRVPADRIGAALIAAHVGGRDLVGTSGGIRRWDGTAKREWRLA